MKLKITGLFREDAIEFDELKRPSPANPGGGLATKCLNLRKAVPAIKLTNCIAEIGAVNITEALWFSGSNATSEMFKKRVGEYQDSRAFNILWTSDMEFARWLGTERETIFAASDVIAGNSEYMVNVLKAYTNEEVVLLTDPVDIEFTSPSDKKKHQIVGVSQVMLEKNIDAIIEIYSLLAESNDIIKRGFLGSSNVWGITIKDEVSRKLELELDNYCDFRIPNATRAEVSRILSESWGFVADSRYDTFSYALAEAMLAGCHCFVGKHPVYDNRPVERFKTPEEAFGLINAAQMPNPNEEARQYVIDNYSLYVFRSQLKNIIGGTFV